MRKPVVLLFCFLFPAISYSQEKRVALVIGNSHYQVGAPLANPENDAEDIGKKLQTAGFDVSLYIDLSQTEMKMAIDEFGAELDKADIGLFFYAGHGVQAKGKNYLIPTDAALKTENDVEYNCVDAGRILAKMEDAGTGTNIVILDACRNNPFERSWSRNSNGNGLAYMDAPGGSLIAYSTAPGKTASDGYSRNSPFTSGLLEYIGTPNLNIEALFKLVRVKVMTGTNGEQVPWESTSLTGDFYFNPDQDKLQTKLADILPDYKESLIEAPDYESQRQELASEIRSVVILPFSNYTGDESKVYLASGMHDALISELGQLGSVRVISKTSTLQYTDFQKSIQEIASDLNVDGVVETSLIGLGDKLRIQVKLYNAFPEEQMLWTQVYTSDMSDILNLYNRVTKNIADEIQLSLTPEQEMELRKTEMVNPEVYDTYLRSQQLLAEGSKESMQKALEYLNDAVLKEPDWAPLYSGLANVWFFIQQMGYEAPSVATPEIYSNLKKALELDPNLSETHYYIAMIAHMIEWDWEKSEMEYLKALAINPNDAQSRMLYAQLLCVLQRTDEGLAQGRLAYNLDPQNPLIKIWYTAVLLSDDKCKEALDIAEEITLTDPGNIMANNGILFAAYRCKEYDKVIKADSYILPLYNFSEDNIKEFEGIFKEDGFIKAYEEILKHLEVFAEKYPVSPFELAYRYLMADKPEKAINWLEKGYELHDPVMTYIGTTMFNFDPLFNNPRFIDIVEKMHLPLPGK